MERVLGEDQIVTPFLDAADSFPSATTAAATTKKNAGGEKQRGKPPDTVPNVGGKRIARAGGSRRGPEVDEGCVAAAVVLRV